MKTEGQRLIDKAFRRAEEDPDTPLIQSLYKAMQVMENDRDMWAFDHNVVEHWRERAEEAEATIERVWSLIDMPEVLHISAGRLERTLNYRLGHCGQPPAYGFDGNPNHHRGMWTHCDPVRCDVDPAACGRPQAKRQS